MVGSAVEIYGSSKHRLGSGDWRERVAVPSRVEMSPRYRDAASLACRRDSRLQVCKADAMSLSGEGGESGRSRESFREGCEGSREVYRFHDVFLTDDTRSASPITTLLLSICDSDSKAGDWFALHCHD